jgi:hypothetical protein
MQISLETVSYFDLCLSNYKNKNIEKLKN